MSPRTLRYASKQQSVGALRVDLPPPPTHTTPARWGRAEYTEPHELHFVALYVYIFICRLFACCPPSTPPLSHSHSLPPSSSPSSKSGRRHRAPHEPLALSLSFVCTSVPGRVRQTLSCFVQGWGAPLHRRSVVVRHS